MITESDKISALKIAYDILSGCYEDPEEDFIVKLAEIGQKVMIYQTHKPSRIHP